MTGKLSQHIAVSYISFKKQNFGVFKTKIGEKSYFLLLVFITGRYERIIYL